MMGCREVTRLMSEAGERPLTRGERLALLLHKAICAGCRNYARHLTVLREAMRRFAAGAGESGPGRTSG